MQNQASQLTNGFQLPFIQPKLIGVWACDPTYRELQSLQSSQVRSCYGVRVAHYKFLYPEESNAAVLTSRADTRYFVCL